MNRLKYPRLSLDQLKKLEFQKLQNITICDLFAIRYCDIEALKPCNPKSSCLTKLIFQFDFLSLTIILIY